MRFLLLLLLLSACTRKRVILDTGLPGAGVSCTDTVLFCASKGRHVCDIKTNFTFTYNCDTIVYETYSFPRRAAAVCCRCDCPNAHN